MCVHSELSVWLCLLLTADNGLNPVWVQTQFVFDIHNPTFSFLRFTIYDEDMFSDPNFLAQATYPVQLLQTGKSTRMLVLGGPSESVGQVLALVSSPDGFVSC